jgi:hypothetical protein
MNYRALVDAIAAEMIDEMVRMSPKTDKKTAIECVWHDEHFSGYMDNLKDDVLHELNRIHQNL